MENQCIVCGKIIPEGRHICLACGDYDDQQRFRPPKHARQTNGDRIRHMTDEELAEMVSMKVCRIVKPDGKGCPKGFYFGKCDKCVLKWLKQEVKNEGTDD